MFPAIPPPQYDMPFPGRLIEERMDYYAVDAACRERKAVHWGRITGCAWTFRDGTGAIACHIIIPTEDRGERRHEIGHCNGWKHAA